MQICRMCWQLLDDQLLRCDCMTGAVPVTFKDPQEMINHFVSLYRKENKQLKQDIRDEKKYHERLEQQNNLYLTEDTQLRKEIKHLKEILRITKDGDGSH